MSFEPRNIINGAMLQEYMGKNVSIYLNVGNIAASGTNLIGKSSDDKEVKVTLSEPLNTALNGWVEVIGTPDSADTVHCKEIINFDQQENQEEFDTNSHNMMILYWKNCKEIFKTE